MRLVQNTLEKLHHRNYAFLLGNATTALYCTLQALGLKNALIGIPNNVCMNVVLAVKFSGNHPVYLDVSRENLGVSLEALTACQEPLQAVIAVHAYGAGCDIEKISAFCQANNIFLIEDLAVAQGATVAEGPVGSFGVASVVSFGAGKILDVEHGGAILTNDKGLLAEIAKIEQTLPVHTMSAEAKISRVDRHFTQLYNDQYGKDLASHVPNFVALACQAKQAFFFRFNPDYLERLRQGLAQLPQNIAARQARADRLAQRFLAAGIDTFAPPEGSVYWRFNLFLERAMRDSLLHKLLRSKHKISSWFPSVDLFFENRAKKPINTPISDWVGDSILNIWVNDEATPAYLETISTQIVRAVEA